MNEPILVVMAAGMGSRYGGNKQIDPISNNNEIIIDFSIFDAIKAGFKKVVFIIKEDIFDIVKNLIGDKVSKFADVSYVFQDINNIPNEFTVPEDRSKPWGTAHAILSCKDLINTPFAVINADDYYGYSAYVDMYEFLTHVTDNDKYNYAMVGYFLENTVTENGSVARGVCEVNSNNYLKEIVERIKIEKHKDIIEYTEDDGKTFTKLPNPCIVSMNFWGFTPSIFAELEARFKTFLKETIKTNPLKSEMYIPTVVGDLLIEEKAIVKVLPSKDVWYGVTYKEDKQIVVDAIRRLKDEGKYPDKLWEK